jgi:Cu/Ag efflux pump CusA
MLIDGAVVVVENVVERFRTSDMRNRASSQRLVASAEVATRSLRAWRSSRWCSCRC